MSTTSDDTGGDEDGVVDSKPDPNVPVAPPPRSSKMEAAGDPTGDPEAEEAEERRVLAWQRHLENLRQKEQPNQTQLDLPLPLPPADNSRGGLQKPALVPARDKPPRGFARGGF